MSTKMFNQIITVLVILSFVGLSLFSAEPIAAQSLPFNTVAGTGQSTGNVVRGSGLGLLDSLSFITRTQSDRSYDSLQLTLQRISTWSGQLKLSIYTQDPNFDRPGTELQSFVYTYNDLPTAVTTVTLNINSQVLPAGTYWIVFSLVGNASPNEGVNIVSYSSTSYSGDLSFIKTMYRVAGGTWTTNSNNIPFVLYGTIGTAPTPTPTPTITPTPTPVPTPTPPPPPIDAYAYVNQNPLNDLTSAQITNNFIISGSQFYTEDYLNVQKIAFSLYRSATIPTGATVAVIIYEYNGHLNIGDAIATSDSIPYTNIPTTSPTTNNVNFTFTNCVLDPNKSYYAGIQVTAPTSYTLYAMGNNIVNVNTPRANTLRSNGNSYRYIASTSAWQTIINENITMAVYGYIDLPPTPTPTPSPTPSPAPQPEEIIDQNTFPDTSNKISIATSDNTITTANSALLQPFLGNGKYITSVTVNVNRLGTLPYNGVFYAGIAENNTNSEYDLIALSQPVIFNIISSNVNQVTFLFDGTVFLYDQSQYYLVLTTNANGLSNVDNTSPCLFVVVQNATDTFVLETMRGGQISATDPALKLWYIIRGTSELGPTPTPPPSITPTPNPQDPVPNPVWTWSIDTTSLWQPLLAWDFAGFILGCWTYSLGGSFFYILVLIISVALYIRYQNLTVLIVLWFIVGSLYAALIPLAGPVGISFIIFGFAGLLYKALAEPKS